MEEIKSPFRVCFKILNFYGFILPADCKRRWKVYGLFCFCYIHVQFLLASIYRMCFVTNFDQFIIAVIYIIFSVNLLVKIVNFKWKESEIIGIMRDLEDIQATQTDKDHVRALNREMENKISAFFLSEVSVGTILVIAILVFSNQKIFSIPLLYSTENGFGYYALFALHLVQMYAIGTSSIAVESLFTLSLMMIENSLKNLKKMLGNLSGDEENLLKSCVDTTEKIVR